MDQEKSLFRFSNAWVSTQYNQMNYRIRVLAVHPLKKTLGAIRLKIFTAPKNFCDVRPVHEKNRLKLAHFF